MKIALSYYYDVDNPHIWCTPSGLGKAFEKAGHTITPYSFDPTNCNLSKLINDADQYDMIFFCVAGPSSTFDSQLRLLKSKTKTKILMELGDDVIWSKYHHDRVNYIDHGFTPDLRCANYYKSINLPVSWMPCWCDDYIFRKIDCERQNICVTTCGNRACVNSLQNVFKDRFINKRVFYHENTTFFNSGTISFQYARYDEITRRLFEAGGCGLAILTNRISKESGIYDLFIEDEDICYYSDELDCVRKMKKLLDDDSYRNKLAENMYNKITANHLVGNRVQQIIKTFNEGN